MSQISTDTLDTNGQKTNGLALNQMIVLLHYYEAEEMHRQEEAVNYQRFGDNWILYRYSDGACVRDEAIARYRDLTIKQLYFARRRLKNRGYLHWKKGVWCLTDKGRAAIEAGKPITSGPIKPLTGFRMPRKGVFSQQLWSALRTKITATIPEMLLLMQVSIDDSEKAQGSAQRLLHWWAKAHIVQIMPRRLGGQHPKSNGFKRYRLIRDLGPAYPIIRRKRAEVYDPNRRRNMRFKDVAALP